MDNSLLYQKISLLPPDKMKEVETIIDSMLIRISIEKPHINTAKAGSGKGMFTIMPGFDDPLEDFKEYME